MHKIATIDNFVKRDFHYAAADYDIDGVNHTRTDSLFAYVDTDTGETLGCLRIIKTMHPYDESLNTAFAIKAAKDGSVNPLSLLSPVAWLTGKGATDDGLIAHMIENSVLRALEKQI